MKIVSVKSAVLGDNALVRIGTDEGVSGYGPLRPGFLPAGHLQATYADLLLGEDPTDVENVMLRIRHLGGFKPWGSIVGGIEIALWDLAGKAAGLPVHKLLGGKVRSRVRTYNGGVRRSLRGFTPDDFADAMRAATSGSEGFSIVKQWLSYHNRGDRDLVDFSFGERRGGAPHPNRGLLTTSGLAYVVECVEAMVSALPADVPLALDLGPGWTLPDARKLARAVEGLRIAWLEDMLTGDFSHDTGAHLYRELTASTTTAIHTGEQIYLRNNFRELLETRAVDVIGPDPVDIGGIAELKWVAEYADLHGVLVAPHGVHNGIVGLAATVQVCATLPDNFIAFEHPFIEPDWWRSIVTGLPDPLVRNGTIAVPEGPGLGIEFDVEAARSHLPAEYADFFDD
jgi:L-alanine-DL-glutamate epimerase-like enolase superfamily enzyme